MNRTLSQELADTTFHSLPEGRAVAIALGVLVKLEGIHANGGVRGDICPANILLNAEGAAALATAAPEATDWSYCSPEQVLGAQIDYRSDLFNVGVVLYEMLTGNKPFRGDSNESLFYSIVHCEPSRQLEISGAMWTVLSKALKKNPDERYSSAEEFDNAIKSAAAPASFISSVSYTAPATEAAPAPMARPNREPIAPSAANRRIQSPPTPVYEPPVVRQIQITTPYELEFDRPARPMPSPRREHIYREEPKPKSNKGVVIGLMLAVIFLIIGVQNSLQSSSDSMPVETPGEFEPIVDMAPTRPASTSSLEFTCVAILPNGSSVKMPSAPSTQVRQFGPYKADVQVATSSGASYLAGELVGAPATKDLKTLQGYSQQIAKSQANIQVNPPTSRISNRNKGGQTQFYLRVGKQRIEGRVVVFNVRGRIVFFECMWPGKNQKFYDPTKFFGSIKL